MPTEAAPAAQHTLIADLRAAEIAAQKADIPVPAADQIFHRLLRGRLVVGGQGGQVGKAQILGRVGQKDAGYADLVKALTEQLQVAAQEENAQGLALAAELARIGHLVGLFVQVIDGGVAVAVPQQALDTLQNVGEQHVVGAFDDDSNAGRGLLF